MNIDLHMINVDGQRKILWEDNDFFLRHDQTFSKSEIDTLIDFVGTKWVHDIDFPFDGNRRRMLNFNNPVLRELVKDIWGTVIQDVIEKAQDLGKEDRILNFTLNSTPSAESEYWFAFFVGNDGNQFNGNFRKANSDAARINWIDQWQNDLRDLHGELSNLVSDELILTGSDFNFRFGAQLSAAYDIAGLKRGTFDLANVASKLNSGDWLNNADIASVVFPGYNHNFSMDYYGSIAERMNLVASNEISWPGFLVEWAGLTEKPEAEAYQQQVIQSYNHGAKAFFVTNWSTAQLDTLPIKERAYGDLIDTLTAKFDISDTYIPFRTEAIFIEPWAIYKTETPELGVFRNTVDNVYVSIKSIYNKLSSNGELAVNFITSAMLLTDQPIFSKGFNQSIFPA